MGLVANGIYGIKVASGATALGTLPINRKSFATNSLTWENKSGVAANREKVSYPNGLFQSAFHMPLKYGGIGVTLRGSSTLTSAIQGPANMSATLTGGGAITDGDIARGVNLNVTLTGGGTVTSNIKATAKMTAVIRIGASPSAFDVAQAVLNAVASDYNITGTIGAKINDAGSGGVQPAMLNTETGDIIIPLE